MRVLSVRSFLISLRRTLCRMQMRVCIPGSGKPLKSLPLIPCLRVQKELSKVRKKIFRLRSRHLRLLYRVDYEKKNPCSNYNRTPEPNVQIIGTWFYYNFFFYLPFFYFLYYVFPLPLLSLYTWWQVFNFLILSCNW